MTLFIRSGPQLESSILGLSCSFWHHSPLVRRPEPGLNNYRLLRVLQLYDGKEVLVTRTSPKMRLHIPGVEQGLTK